MDDSGSSTAEDDPIRRRFSRRAALQAGGAAAATSLLATTGQNRGVAAQGATPGAVATPESNVEPAALAAATDQFIRTAMQTYGVPGAAVAVVYNDQAVLSRGYGVLKLGTSDAVNENTIFQLGSNTKPFTSAALGTVVDQGKLGWDDLVGDHLPEFELYDPYPTRYATVRDLLAHRSGLPAFTGDILGDLGYDRAEILRRIRFLPPGSSFREVAAYSNLGFFIAGQVLARLTGSTWEAAVEDRLLKPLGLTRTAPSAAVNQSGGNVSSNHAVIDGKLQTVPWYDQTLLGAAGTMTSTAANMARWMRMLLNGGSLDGTSVLKPDTVEAIFLPSMVVTPSFSETPPIGEQSGFSYGLGWGNYHDNGEMVLEKGGAISGIRSVVELVPGRKLGIAVLSNRDLVLLPEAIRAFVLAQVLGPSTPNAQQAIQERNAELAKLTLPTPAPANPGSPSLPVDGYIGPYQNDLYGAFTVERSGAGIAIAAGPARYPGTLAHFSHDTFQLSWPPVDFGYQLLTFVIGPDGKASAFDTQTLGRFERVQPSTAGGG